MKKYSTGRTNLRLTEKAQSIYDVTDPLDIIEREIEDDEGNITYSYDIKGCFETNDHTEDEINEILEEFADKIEKDEAEDEAEYGSDE